MDLSSKKIKIIISSGIGVLIAITLILAIAFNTMDLKFFYKALFT